MSGQVKSESFEVEKQSLNDSRSDDDTPRTIEAFLKDPRIRGLIGRSAFYEGLRRGEIRALRIGKRWLISPRSFFQQVAQGNNQ